MKLVILGLIGVLFESWWIYASFGHVKSSGFQLNALIQEKEGMATMFDQERGRHANQIQTLQGKLSNLNDAYVARMNDLNLSGEGKVPLQPEIESLKVLLEEEEGKWVGCRIRPREIEHDESSLHFHEYHNSTDHEGLRNQRNWEENEIDVCII